MSPHEIRATLDSLRRHGERLRRRPAAQTQDALCRVLDGWSDPDSAWRLELEAALPAATGFSGENVREGLSRALARWNGDALRELVTRELGGLADLDEVGSRVALGFDSTAVLLAGSIPMPTLLAILAPLVLRTPVLAKCASRDPVTAPLVAKSIAEVDPELGACVEIATFRGDDEKRMQALLEADCVVAAGADETISAIAARVTAPRRLVTHGHRVSIAALGAETMRGDQLAHAAESLALDVALWDQLGCLSPIAVYVAGEDTEAPDRVAHALASSLEQAEKRWPRGRVEAADAARFEHELAGAELRAAAGQRVEVHSGSDHAWAVVREQNADLRDAPLHRFVRVVPVPDARALLGAIAPLGPHLAAVAIAGFGAEAAELSHGLARLGASRICEPGALQAPPLDWRHEGRGVLLPLSRFADRDAMPAE